MLSLDTVLLPRALDAPIRCAPNPNVVTIASAQRVEEECTVVLTACGAFDTGDPNDDWKLEEYEQLLREWGVTKKSLEDPWRVAGDVLDLCSRLIRVAKDVNWSGCFAITS